MSVIKRRQYAVLKMDYHINTHGKTMRHVAYVFRLNKFLLKDSTWNGNLFKNGDVDGMCKRDFT